MLNPLKSKSFGNLKKKKFCISPTSKLLDCLHNAYRAHLIQLYFEEITEHFEPIKNLCICINNLNIILTKT